MAVCFGIKKSKTTKRLTSDKHDDQDQLSINHHHQRSQSQRKPPHHSKDSSMPHDLSRSTANSASSSALSYTYGGPQSTASASSSSNNTDDNHFYHKTSKKSNEMDISEDEDDNDEDVDDGSKQLKKLKRTVDRATLAQEKFSIVNADMIFYCFEILGNHLFNGKNHLGKHQVPSSGTNGQLVPSTAPKFPSEPYPLFVTWFIGTDKQLRGCIGTFSPMNLAQGLREYAITSAINDSRFSPISRDEYPLLSCAVSVLTRFEPCSSYSDWVIGLHGIRIEFFNERGSRRSATYLPEIAHEQGWNHIQTLDSLLRKGGYRAPITSDMRKSVQVTRYQSEKLTLHYNDYVQSRITSTVTTTYSCSTTTIVTNRLK